MYLYGKRAGMGRRIGPQTWDRIVEFLEILGLSMNAQNWMGCYVGIYALNSMLVCMRSGIVMEIGFKNWNRCRMSGLPVDSPLPLFWGLNCGVL